MYMDDIKLFAKNEKELETPTMAMRIYSKNIGICHTNNEKRKTTHNGRIRSTKSRKTQKAQRKGNLQLLRNIRSRHHQINGEERKKGTL